MTDTRNRIETALLLLALPVLLPAVMLGTGACAAARRCRVELAEVPGAVSFVLRGRRKIKPADRVHL